jgi:hypothetical protein
LQDAQVSVHAVSQHTPSTQKPEAQTVAAEQVVPFLLLHAPLPSQACPLAQLPGTSVPAATGAQVPSWLSTAQDWQTPEQDTVPQHTPSTQKPEAHVEAVAEVHPSPLPRLVTLYSQVSLVDVIPSIVPPNTTTTPRWLSNVAAGDPGNWFVLAGRLRKYQVGPLVSISQTTLGENEFGVSSTTGTTARRRRLS